MFGLRSKNDSYRKSLFRCRPFLEKLEDRIDPAPFALPEGTSAPTLSASVELARLLQPGPTAPSVDDGAWIDFAILAEPISALS